MTSVTDPAILERIRTDTANIKEARHLRTYLQDFHSPIARDLIYAAMDALAEDIRLPGGTYDPEKLVLRSKLGYLGALVPNRKLNRPIIMAIAGWISLYEKEARRDSAETTAIEFAQEFLVAFVAPFLPQQTGEELTRRD